MTDWPNYKEINYQRIVRGKQNAHQGAQASRHRWPQIDNPPNKDWVGFACHTTEGINAKILNGTCHIVEPHKVGSPDDGEDDSADESTNESFYSLFGRKLDERRSSNSDPPDVGKAIIANNERCWNPEPDETFKDVVHNKVTTEQLISFVVRSTWKVLTSKRR